MAGHGKARPGMAGRGKARNLNYGGAGHGKARQGTARQGVARQGKGFNKRSCVMAISINKPNDLITRRVRLCGLTEIMFDRYAGDNQTQLEPWQKLYLEPGESKVIGLPAINIMSSLTAHNTNSYPKRLRDKRKFKDIANACLSFLSLGPSFIPFQRAGKPIVFGKFAQDERDPVSGIYIDHRVARLDKGIPNPKHRPVLPLPWALEFDLTIFPNREIKEQEVVNLIEEGGRAIGIGTYRGVFGKFFIEQWK